MKRRELFGAMFGAAATGPLAAAGKVGGSEKRDDDQFLWAVMVRATRDTREGDLVSLANSATGYAAADIPKGSYGFVLLRS